MLDMPPLPGLRRVYAFGAAWMGVVVMPVYVPFLVARGLTPGDVLSLQAVYGVAVMLCEIPTGYICDVAGRRRTILIGATLNVLGLVAFASADGFVAYAAVELLLAAGWSLVSGADIALIYDVLDTADAPRDIRRRVLANYVMAQVLGEAAAALLGGALTAWSFAAVGWVTAAEAILPLAIAFALPGRLSAPANPVRLREIPRAVHTVFADRTRLLVFANMIIWGLSTFMAVWLLQPYWQEQGIPLPWFGVLWAGTLVTVGIVSRLAPALTHLAGHRGALLVLTLCPIAAYAGMAWLGGAAGVGFGFLFYASRGLNSVNLREAFNHGLPSRMRATFNSLASGVFRLSYALCGPVVGLIMDRAGLDTALAVLAGVFASVFAVLTIPLLRRTPGRSSGQGY